MRCLINNSLLILLFSYWLFSLSLLCWLPLLLHATFHSSCTTVMLDCSKANLVKLGTTFPRPPFALWLPVKVMQKRNLRGISEVELKQSHCFLKNFRTSYGDEKPKKCLAGSICVSFLSFQVSSSALWFCWPGVIPEKPPDAWLYTHRSGGCIDAAAAVFLRKHTPLGIPPQWLDEPHLSDFPESSTLSTCANAGRRLVCDSLQSSVLSPRTSLLQLF